MSVAFLNRLGGGNGRARQEADDAGGLPPVVRFIQGRLRLWLAGREEFTLKGAPD